jgi:hypothetical protein
MFYNLIKPVYFDFIHVYLYIYIHTHTHTHTHIYIIMQSVPLATEPSISIIILTPMKILQRNLNRSIFAV